MEGAITVVGAEDMPSGTEISIGFSGAFDSATESSSFVMDLSDAAAGVPGSEEIPPEFADLFGEMEIRAIGDTAYMKFGLFSMFGVTTEWVSMPAEEANTTASGFGANPTNPTDMLSAFDSDNAEVVEIGREQVRGIDTTHYLMTVDVEAMMAEADAEARAELEDLGGLPGGGMLPVDFWIGDDGNVYRFSFAVDGAAEPDAGFESMVMLWEMYDYGADVGIVAPPADQVTDGSSLPGFTTS